MPNTTDMTIIISKCSDGTDIYIVRQDRAGDLGDFASLAPAERFVRSRGHFVRVVDRRA